MKIKLIGAVLACVLVGTAAIGGERAANRRFEGGLKALGFKAYWSLLDEDQQGEAKSIIKDHVARTAPDRMEALSIIVRFRGDVARVLTVEQRLKAAGISRHMKGLSREEKAVIFDKLLEGTDRAGLAVRVEEAADAPHADRVELGLAIFDQLYDAVEPALAEKLALTAGQREQIRGLYEGLKTEIRPVAERLAVAKGETIRRGLAILTVEQRAKLDTFRDEVMVKVLDFIRG